MNESLKNKIDKDTEKSDESEALFVRIMERDGYRCLTATTWQNWNEHWDVMTYKDGVFERIDIKGLKEATADGRTWIELQNVKGQTGWLYASKLDAIAFEKEDRFDFIKRKDLIPIVEKGIKKSDIEDEGFTIYYEKQGLKDYRRYCRKNWGRDDRVVKVPFADIDHLIYKTVFK
jgi:hypothetical protein